MTDLYYAEIQFVMKFFVSVDFGQISKDPCLKHRLYHGRTLDFRLADFRTALYRKY